MKPGKIFLSEQRGIEESSISKTTMTFNSNNYYNEHKQPFRNLTALNDELLVPWGKLEVSIKEASHLLIIPVTGDLFFQGKQHHDTSEVNIGEVKICSLTAGNKFTICNPYGSDFINFLQIWVRDESILENQSFEPIGFDMSKSLNHLIPVASPVAPTLKPLPFALSIGQFGGRAETIYSMRNKNNTFFTFIISGAFEINGRLMHPRDGLALWDVSSIEVEALSGEATLLCLELFN